MQSEFQSRAGALRPPDDLFQILIVYENKAALGQARALETSLAKGCLSEAKIKSTAWTFSRLGHPRLQAQAAKTAAQANLIVVSARERTALPMHVQSLMKKCLAGKQSMQTALVALLNAQSVFDSPALPLDHSLRRLAERSGVAFFVTRDYGAAG